MSGLNRLKVGIFINTLTGGGRRIVTDRMIYNLNQFGIEPDLITFRINESYKQTDLRFHPIVLPTKLPGRPKWMYEYKVIALNKRVQVLADQYDLLINSNNSILFAPEVPTIVYMHFPRNARYRKDFARHLSKTERGIDYLISRKLVNYLYAKQQSVPDNFTIVANSRFTKEMFVASHPVQYANAVSVLYPPVDFSIAVDRFAKEKSVVSLGRFSSTKHQLDQIEVARKCTGFSFHLIGFVGDKESKTYYRQCEDRITRYGLKNVFLYPNIDNREKDLIMRRASFFIHTLHNEPFGISTVEAIARGCIPIVPNSGGQKEVVPYPELRFDQIDEIADRLHAIQNQDHLIGQLMDHIAHFSTASFDKQFNTLFLNKIDE